MLASILKINRAVLAILTVALIPSSGSSAGFFNLPVYMQMPTIAFSTTAQTLYPDVCSAVFTLRTYHGNVIKRPPVYAGGLTINLSASGPVTFYSDSSCQTPTAAVSITGTGTSVSFYAMASATGAYTITATPALSGIKVASQSGTSVANPFIWIGGTSANWNVGSNWSGGSVPSNSHVAYFDNSCTTFCSPTTTNAVSIRGVKIKASYTGTITQGDNLTFQAATAGWIQEGGTFIGSTTGHDLNIAVGGSSGGLVISGGTFTGSTGTTTIGGAFTKSGGTFNHGNGTFLLNSSGSITFSWGGATFKNLSFGSGSYTLASDTSVSGDLNLANTSSFIPTMTGQTINVAGNVIVPAGAYGNKGTTTINLNGSTNQNVDVSAATEGNFPNIKISSTGGTVSLIGSLIVQGNYEVVSGTVSPGTSTLTLTDSGTSCSYNCTYTFSAVGYNNVAFMTGQGQPTITDALNVNGTLTLSSTNSFNTGLSGTINAKGNVVVLNRGIYSSRGSTPVLNIVGNSNQSIDCSAAPLSYSGWRALLPAINIQSTGGTVSFVGNCSVDNVFKYTSGTVNAGTNRIELFVNGATGFVDSGAMSFYDLSIYSTSNGNTVSILSNLNVSRNIYLGYFSPMTVNMPNPGAAYAITVGGNLTVTSGTTLNRYGSALTYGSLSNSGTINP